MAQIVKLSDSGKKASVITSDGADKFLAFYIQEDEQGKLSEGLGQVLASKHFATLKYAERWAAKQLAA